MFPSSNNGNDPISYSDHQIFHKPFFYDITPNSKIEDPPSLFFHLHSPFIYHELELEDHPVFLHQHHDLLLQQQPLRVDGTAAETLVNMVDSNKNGINGLMKDCNKTSHNTAEQIPRKRSSKRDRHSKINTAQGPRDRRMRLSLKVAREFFDLQDKLGFDKASKTVEWLLIQAKAEIIKLGGGLPQMNYSCSFGTKSASSISECEVVSGIDESAIKGRMTKGKFSSCVKKDKKVKQSRKTAFNPLARESRERARARARARTREKMRSRKFDESKLSGEATNQELNQFGSWSPFETGEESGTQSHNMNPSLEVLAEVEEPSSHEIVHLETTTEGMVEDSLVTMNKWSTPYSSIFNCLQNVGIPQEHQYADYQISGKPWDACHNHNLC